MLLILARLHKVKGVDVAIRALAAIPGAVLWIAGDGALEGALRSLAENEGVADRVESTLQERPEREIGTAEVGAFVMEELKVLDKVAYVRFASVYRHFRDIGEFMTELKDLLSSKE